MAYRLTTRRKGPLEARVKLEVMDRDTVVAQGAVPGDGFHREAERAEARRGLAEIAAETALSLEKLAAERSSSIATAEAGRRLTASLSTARSSSGAGDELRQRW